MKHSFSLWLCFTLMLALTGCHASKDQNQTRPRSSQSPRVLVAYFSATGTTQQKSQLIVEVTGGTLYEIIPETPYTDNDLDYTDAHSRTSLEQDDENARPKIKNLVSDISQYDYIFLGYPLWHGEAPRIISTFLESFDFSNKTMIPFCTSHSSDIEDSDQKLHTLVSSALWKEGYRLNTLADKEDISKWIDSLGIDFQKYETAPRVMLNSGYAMPSLGLGTYSLSGETCIDSIYTAIKNGYRSIDTAYMYHNEKEVGSAIKKAIDDGLVTREDMFITTKLYPNQFADPDTAIEEALEKLDIDYIDLMLLHHPGTDDVKAYQAIEKYIQKGKIHSVGLSNYYIEELDDFLPQVKTPPALIQNEIHPYYQELKVVPYIQSHGIMMEGWYPLGGRGHQSELLADEVLVDIAKNHQKSVAQVILRWNIQRQVIAIPGSSHPDHIKENISIFDFKLTDEEMSRITKLERNEKHDWY